MPKVAKVWSHDRKIKKAVVLHEEENLLQTLLQTASKKFNIKGTSIVLENNGIDVDEDELLKMFIHDGETFMLLDEEMEWKSVNSYELNTSDLSKNVNLLLYRNRDSSDEIDMTNSADEINRTNSAEDISRTISDNEISRTISLQEVDRTMEITESSNVNLHEGNGNWLNFSFNWKLCSKSMLNLLQEINGGTKKLEIENAISYLIDEAVLQMRKVSTKIPTAVIHIVATEITKKFPKIYQDLNDKNKVIGDRCHTLMKQLKNKNYNLNRPKESGSTLSQELGIQCKNLRVLQNAQSDCVKWQPELKASVENLERKRLYLRDWMKQNKNSSCEENEDAENYEIRLQKEKAEADFLFTFAYQRKFLNNFKEKPTINNIIEKWPILVEPRFLYWHWEILMDKKIDLIEEGFKIYMEVIFQYGHKKKLSAASINSVEECTRIICANFAEKFEDLFPVYPVSL